jgi:hypothetical protein
MAPPHAPMGGQLAADTRGAGPWTVGPGRGGVGAQPALRRPARVLYVALGAALCLGSGGRRSGGRQIGGLTGGTHAAVACACASCRGVAGCSGCSGHPDSGCGPGRGPRPPSPTPAGRTRSPGAGPQTPSILLPARAPFNTLQFPPPPPSSPSPPSLPP